jgi:aquaporin related protein
MCSSSFRMKPNTASTLLPLTPPLASSSTTTITSSPNRRRHLTPAIRRELTIFLGEFVGTFMFLFLAFAGTQISITASGSASGASDVGHAQDVSKLLYISLSFGASLALNVALFADVSGAMFNPAVTTSVLLLGRIKWPRAAHTILAHLLSSILAAYIVSALLSGPLTVSTVLAPHTSVVRGFFLEMILTAQLVLSILMLPTGPMKPAFIGLTLFVAELCSVFYTGGSLNPARSFGPAVVVGFTSSHWVYWVGPVVGGALGAGVFKVVERMREDQST